MSITTELQVLQVIAEHLGLSVEDLDRNADLREELSLGPIELNDLLSHLALEFEVSFKPDEIEDLQKVEDLIVLVEDNLLD